MVYPKSVYLDYGSGSNERYITPEGYAAIKALIQQYQMCGKCKSVIDKTDHLLVGRHLCLSCLLQKQSGLRFLGPVEVDSDGDYTYSYIDDDNVVYTSKANSSDSAAKDTYGSILRSGFELPQFYVPFKGDKDNPTKLGRYNWTVYGSLAQSAIVLEYKDTYPTVHVVFIAYKEGEVVELNKRNLAFKQMFERAKAVVESTKRNGYYNINGYEQPRYSDETLYPIIARMEAAVWDVQKAFMPKKVDYQQPELTTEPEQPRPALQIVQPEEEIHEVETSDQEAPGEEIATPQEQVEEVNEDPVSVNIETEHVNETEEALTQDQPDQAEQVAEVQQSEEVVAEKQGTETSLQEERPLPEENRGTPDSVPSDKTEESTQSDTVIEIGSKSKRKRGSLSIVPTE